MFAELAERAGMSYTLHISYLEIYNNVGYDLLDPSHETKRLEDLPQVRNGRATVQPRVLGGSEPAHLHAPSGVNAGG